MSDELRKKWADKFKGLVGRTIVNVRWMTDEERDVAGWDSTPITLQLDDGTLLWPSMDDEGNDAGALFVQAGTKTQGIPEGAPVI